MAKRRCCSICHNQGHNSRTCKVLDNPPEDSAVRETTIKNNHSSLQLDLMLSQGSSADQSISSSQQPQPQEIAPPATNNKSREIKTNKGEFQVRNSKRNKKNHPEFGYLNLVGERWTAEEHLSFLWGMRYLGTGAWKAMSEKYVPTRTANQISSHAQKYFKRMNNPLQRKRGHSIFDLESDDMVPACIPFIQRLCQISGGGHQQLPPPPQLHPLPSSSPHTTGDIKTDQVKSSKNDEINIRR